MEQVLEQQVEAAIQLDLFLSITTEHFTTVLVSSAQWRRTSLKKKG